jgi:hypothetical protein
MKIPSVVTVRKFVRAYIGIYGGKTVIGFLGYCARLRCRDYDSEGVSVQAMMVMNVERYGVCIHTSLYDEKAIIKERPGRGA